MLRLHLNMYLCLTLLIITIDQSYYGLLITIYNVAVVVNPLPPAYWGGGGEYFSVGLCMEVRRQLLPQVI